MSKITVSTTLLHKELEKAGNILKNITDLIDGAEIELTVSMLTLVESLETIENNRVAIRNKLIIAAVNKYPSTRVTATFGVTPARVSQIAPRKK